MEHVGNRQSALVLVGSSVATLGDDTGGGGVFAVTLDAVVVSKGRGGDEISVVVEASNEK